jgi:hypothetical protein
MMVYHIRNYWVFGHFPLSSILETRKHDVSETGAMELPLSKGLNLSRCLPRPPHLKTETDPVSETSCSLVPTISDDGKSPKTQ